MCLIIMEVLHPYLVDDYLLRRCAEMPLEKFEKLVMNELLMDKSGIVMSFVMVWHQVMPEDERDDEDDERVVESSVLLIFRYLVDYLQQEILQ